MSTIKREIMVKLAVAFIKKESWSIHRVKTIGLIAEDIIAESIIDSRNKE